VLRLVAQGLSQRDIAEQLVISRKNANNHIAHVYARAASTPLSGVDRDGIRCGISLLGGD
jgi:FixJ family two-component response regulator